MERLIENHLIYKSMYHVDQPHMVARYNLALKAFGLPETARKAFVVDAAGFSPEIASDLGDEHYLDPHGINQRFIILSPAQETLPVITPQLSSTTELIHAFYRQNAESLRLLTLKDVVFGEIEDETWRVNTIEDLLSIRQVEFQLRTGGNLLEQAERLKTRIDEFYTLDDSWKDSALIHEILTLSKQVGDVRYNNLAPRHTRFHLPSFWTSHFGGIYIFREDDALPVVIGKDKSPDFARENEDIMRYIPRSDAAGVLSFLQETGRLGKLEIKWLKRSSLVKKRFQIFVALQIAASDPGLDLRSMDERKQRRWIQEHYEALAENPDFAFLNMAQKALMNNAVHKLENIPAAQKLMLMRADPRHRDVMLVNRLLSEYAPFDFLTRFFVNKPGFFEDYRGFGDNQRDYAVSVITKAHKPDPNAFWKRIFEQPEE